MKPHHKLLDTANHNFLFTISFRITLVWSGPSRKPSQYRHTAHTIRYRFLLTSSLIFALVSFVYAKIAWRAAENKQTTMIAVMSKAEYVVFKLLLLSLWNVLLRLWIFFKHKRTCETRSEFFERELVFWHELRFLFLESNMHACDISRGSQYVINVRFSSFICHSGPKGIPF